MRNPVFFRRCLRFSWLMLIIVLASCTRRPVTAPAPRTPIIPNQATTAEPPSGTWFAPVADILTCRNAVQRLNDHLHRHPAARPMVLSNAEQHTLRELLRLDDGELAEISQPTFTPLDAHYLDGSFLLRDAARSLHVDDLPAPLRARAAADWVTRQVRLVETPSAPDPIQFVLRRGWGSALDRALIFLALLPQLGLEGCLIGYANPEHPDQPRFWATGVCGERDVLLFDLVTGQPFPTAQGDGFLTLSQVQQLSLLNLTPAIAAPRLTPEQLRQSQIYVTCPLSALAPRMRYLEQILATSNPVVLSTDPVQTMHALRKTQRGAAEEIAVRFWNPPQPVAPPRRLRAFLPPQAGGIDRPHAASSRLHSFLQGLVPAEKMPAPLRGLPGEPGKRLHDEFAQPFINLVLEASMPRDWMLRGRYDEASAELAKMRDELKPYRQLLWKDKELPRQAADWCQRLRAAHGDLLLAQRQAQRQPSPQAEQAVHAAEQRVAHLWQHSDKPYLLMQAALAEPLGAEVTYWLALCKHEQAARCRQRRDWQRLGEAVAAFTVPPALPWPALVTGDDTCKTLWRSAAQWWQTYLDEFPHAPAADAARRLRLQAEHQEKEKH